MTNTRLTPDERKKVFERNYKAGRAVEKEFLNDVVRGAWGHKDARLEEEEENLSFWDIIIPSLGITNEVKRDLKSEETGNFTFEIRNRDTRKFTGLAITRATNWIHCDSTIFYCFEVAKLRAWVKSRWEELRKVYGGDNKSFYQVLAPKFYIDPIIISKIKRHGGT